MKNLYFNDPDGWPLSADAMHYIQQMIQQVEGLAYLGGQSYIVSGCDVVGSNVSPGLVVLNGEVFPFEGGLLGTHMIVVDQTEEKEYFGGILKPFYQHRKAAFGDAPGKVAWADMKRNTPGNSIFARLEKLERIAAPFVVQGGMVLWKKPAADIPAGWAEVVDWRGRLPMGYDPSDLSLGGIGSNGGSKTHVLQVSNLPPHDHSNGNFNQLMRKSFPAESSTVDGADGAGAGTEPALPVSGQIQSVGSSVPVNHLNPYRIVMFIEYVGN